MVVPLITCVGPEVGLEVRALGVGLGAAGILTAVDGRSFFHRGPPPTLLFHSTRGQMWPDHHGLLVIGQMHGGLGVGVGVVTKKAGVETKMRHVAVRSRVGGHDLWLDEPAVWHDAQWVMLLGVVVVKVPGSELSVTSSAVSVSTASLWDVKLIDILYVREYASIRLVAGVIMVVDLWLR